MTPTAGSWKSARGRGPFRRHYGAHCTIATAVAGSRAATCRSAKAITSVTGPRVGPRRSRTSRCFAGATTAPSTPPAVPADPAVHEEGYQVERQSDGGLRFRRPDGRPLPDVPPPPAVPADPVVALRARNEAAGLSLNARTTCPGWLGERLDVGWAIDVLHPRALQPRKEEAQDPCGAYRCP